MNSLERCIKDPIKVDSPVKSVCVSRGGLVGGATPRRVLMRPVEGRLGQAKLQVGRVVMSPDDSTIITVDSEGHMHLIELFHRTTDNFQLNMAHRVKK